MCGEGIECIKSGVCGECVGMTRMNDECGGGVVCRIIMVNVRRVESAVLYEWGVW